MTFSAKKEKSFLFSRKSVTILHLSLHHSFYILLFFFEFEGFKSERVGAFQGFAGGTQFIKSMS